MIPMPAGTRIWVACGATDMRKGVDGLAMLAQDVVKQSPYSGHIFVFRGKRADQTTFNIPITICRHRVSMASPSWQAAADMSPVRTWNKRNRGRRSS
jgi:transposase